MPAAQTSLDAHPDALDYDIVDVFTDRAFAGNPLAVVYGADHLSDAQLQAIANEFNLSETTFPVERTSQDVEAGADYRVRIFTPETEIPFAGHPTLGTAWALARRRLVATGTRVQACGAGLVGVQIPADSAAPVELSAAPRDQARRLSTADSREIADLVSLTADDLVGPGFTAGTGLTWSYLQVLPATVGRARTVGRSLAETSVDLSDLIDPIDGVSVFAVTAAGDGSAERPVCVDCRVFVPGFGIAEDPATGSAASGLGAVLVAGGHAAGQGVTHYRIRQGVDLGRPSLLLGCVEARAGRAAMVHVSGQVAAVATGRIRVPD